MYLSLLRLMRPHQWLKNAFVFVGLIFSHAWYDVETVFRVFMALIAFTLAASGVYVFNDIADRQYDSLHPLKKQRPIAQGIVSVKIAFTFACVLLMSAWVIGFSISANLFYLLSSYFLLNIAYSFIFKHILIIDVLVIAAGFMLRILAGTLGVGIVPSAWLLGCGLMLTLFLGFAKRRSEILLLKQVGFRGPAVFLRYNQALLNIVIISAAVGVIASYTCYTFYQDNIHAITAWQLCYTVPWVICGISRYLYLIYQNNRNINYGVDIAQDILSDYPLMLIIVSWLMIVVIVLSHY